MDQLRPYDIFNLVVGAVRVVAAPCDTPDDPGVPTKLEDIEAQIADAGGAYVLADGWFDIGAAVDGSEYSHGHDVEGVEIQQEDGNLFEEVSEITRGMTLNMAEFSPANLQMIEVAEAIETIAGSAGVSAQKSIGMASYSDLPGYRIAMLGTRKLAAGAVVEPAPSGRSRGRRVGVVLNRSTISSDEHTVSPEKATLWNTNVGFTGFPEPGEDRDVAYGRWLLQDAGTITAPA